MVAVNRPGLWRVMAAAIYDLILSFGIFFVSTVIWLPFTAGRAIEAHNVFYDGFLITLLFVYHGYCWTHGGQTLGMKSWRLKLNSEAVGAVTWGQSAVRFAVAFLSWGAFGAGVLWRLIPPGHRCWHDRLSRTSVGWAD